jgi:hypothetical protein
MIGHLDAADWQFIWNVGQSLLTGAIGLYIYFSQREQVRRVALDSLESDVDGRLDQIGNRLTQIEAKMTEAPRVGDRIATLEEAVRGAVKTSDLALVNRSIAAVDKEVAELRGEVKGIQHLLQTIDHYLRNSPPGP